MYEIMSLHILRFFYELHTFSVRKIVLYNRLILFKFINLIYNRYHKFIILNYTYFLHNLVFKFIYILYIIFCAFTYMICFFYTFILHYSKYMLQKVGVFTYIKRQAIFCYDLSDWYLVSFLQLLEYFTNGT